MSKFRRVADTQQIPQNIQDQFFGPEVQAEDDPYAYLRQSQSDRRVRIAQQQMEGGNDAPQDDRSWERITQAEVMRERTSIFDMQSMDISALMPEDLSGRGIRRANYDMDEDLSARDTTYGYNDLWSSALRGPSIYDPTMGAIQDYVNMGAAEQGMFDKEGREAVRQRKAAEWNTEKMREAGRLRPPKMLAARRPAVCRTGDEYEAAGPFGQVDYDALRRNETNRIAQMEESRMQRKAIKRDEMDENELRDARMVEWQERAGKPAGRANDAVNSPWLAQWADNFEA